MSQQNVELPPDYPEGELVFRGRSGIDELIALMRETWREWRFEPERFLDVDEHVVVFARIIGEGEASGAPVELETTTSSAFARAGPSPSRSTGTARRRSRQRA